MNRSGGYSSSSRGRGRHSWRKVTADSSPDFHTPVQADAPSNTHMSGSLDRKPHSSWQVKGHNSDGVVSQKYENVTPDRQGQKHGSSMLRGGGSLDRKPHGSWQVKGHSLDSVVSPDNDNMTPAGHQGQQQGSSSSVGGSYIRGGRQKQWMTSSRASNTADSSHDEHLGRCSVDAKVPRNLDRSFMENVDNLADMSRLSLESDVEVNHCSGAEPLKSTENEFGHENNESSDCATPIRVFDICPPKSGSMIILKPSLLAKNREKRNEMKHSVGGPQGIILRSGMVLLKGYFSTSEQANILKKCRDHGLGPAGFYEPRFREGGKLHLRMMCFGQFWDPEASKYVKNRPIDQAKPPSLPQEFLLLVDRAIKDSHSLIAKQSNNVEDILPPVKPDICLVNYYSQTGRLGLHQDKDESRESLGKGIPIVSFSIGDSAIW